MILRSLEVENFRRFRGRTRLGPLPDGLVVVAGDNEDGKSTLLAALRAALFYRHGWRSQIVDALQPYGSAVRAEVALEFEFPRGQRYRLEKAFGHRPAAQLDCPGGRSLQGEPAEEALAKLLGLAPPGRGPQSEEGDRLGEGPLGLLWVRQGGAWAAEAAASGRVRLQEALGQEVGEVLGGSRAQAVMAAATKGREALLTAGRSAPAGELRQLGERKSALERECGRLAAAAAEYAEMRETLAGNLAQAQAMRQQRPELERQLAAAEQKLEQVRRQQQELGRAQAEMQAATAELAGAEMKLEQVRDLQRRQARSERELSARQAAADEAAAAVRTAGAALDAAARGHRRAGTALVRAEEAHNRQMARLKLAEVEHRRTELREQLGLARAADARRADRERALAAATVDGSALARLRRLDQALTNAQAALNAASPSVELELAGGHRAKWDGKSAAAGAVRSVTARSRIEIDAGDGQWSRIIITPASGAVDPLAKRDRCREAWAKAAEQCGVTSLAAAERASERRSELKHDLAAAQQELGLRAPEGLAALEAAAAALDREAAELDLRSRGPQPDGDAKAAAECAREAAREAADEAKAAALMLEAEQRRWQTAEEEKRKAAEADAVARRELACLGAEAEAQAAGAAQTARTLCEERSIVFRRLRQNLGDPSQAELRFEMAKRAVEGLDTGLRRIEDEVAHLRGRLLQVGGTEEELQAKRQELDWVARRHAELERRAAGYRLLCDVLAETQAAAQRRYFAPVVRHVAPRLQQLLPDCSIALSEDLQIRALQRGGREEPFDTLSHGTREQLAILTRLAFADLLRERGLPALVILDDAPAYADPARFDRMLAILYAAASGGQLLIFTCREADFRPSGATVVRFAAGGAVGAAAP